VLRSDVNDNTENNMDINELVRQLGGAQSVARDLGIDEAQAAAGLDALLPAVVGGFKKQAQARPGGPAGLSELLGALGGGGLLDEVLAPRATDVSRGNEVLGQIFGDRDVSRTVAQSAASQAGLNPDLLKKMLPMAAMLVAGLLSKQGASANAAPGSGPAGALGSLLGGAPGQQAGGGLGSLLDLNGDGNPLDDILGMAGKLLR
jgi:hypothetical protein